MSGVQLKVNVRELRKLVIFLSLKKKKKSLKTLATISFVESFFGVRALELVWETAFVLNVT